MNQISLITRSVERSQNRTLNERRIPSFTTVIYITMTLWCNRWDSKCHLIYTSVSSHVGDVPPPVIMIGTHNDDMELELSLILFTASHESYNPSCACGDDIPGERLLHRALCTARCATDSTVMSTTAFHTQQLYEKYNCYWWKMHSIQSLMIFDVTFDYIK